MEEDYQLLRGVSKNRSVTFFCSSDGRPATDTGSAGSFLERAEDEDRQCC